MMRKTRVIKSHSIKINPQFSLRLRNNNKRCEIRKNDRDYKTGDLLEITDTETGEVFYRIITDMITHKEMPDGLKAGYVALSILILPHEIFEHMKIHGKIIGGQS